MKTRGVSRADANKKVRQEALREQLANQGHVQHVVEISEKLRDLAIPLESSDIQRLRASAEIKMKIIDKYLPNLKMQEIDHYSSDGTMSPKDVDTKTVKGLLDKLLD